MSYLSQSIVDPTILFEMIEVLNLFRNDLADSQFDQAHNVLSRLQIVQKKNEKRDLSPDSEFLFSLVLGGFRAGLAEAVASQSTAQISRFFSSLDVLVQSEEHSFL
jgi:hypothetical protein